MDKSDDTGGRALHRATCVNKRKPPGGGLHHGVLSVVVGRIRQDALEIFAGIVRPDEPNFALVFADLIREVGAPAIVRR